MFVLSVWLRGGWDEYKSYKYAADAIECALKLVNDGHSIKIEVTEKVEE